MEDISIIIVTHNRFEKLQKLLEDINFNTPKAEVIIVINNDDSNAYSSLKSSFSFEWISGVFDTPGSARNAGIQKASRKWVLFLDDDIEIPEGFFQNAKKTFEGLKQEIVLVGGPDQGPPNSSIFSRALSLTLSSPMATAHTRLRHSNKTQEILSGDESNLILCNLWVNLSFIKEHNIFFNEHLFRNEENLFITQIISKGGKALYVPELAVYHHRKTNLFSLGRAVFSSGKNRIKSSLFSKTLFNWLFLIPCAFVIYLLSLPISMQWNHALVPLKIYLTLSLFMSLKVSIAQGRIWPLVMFYQVYLNIIYGLGVLWGLLSLPFWLIRIRN